MSETADFEVALTARALMQAPSLLGCTAEDVRRINANATLPAFFKKIGTFRAIQEEPTPPKRKKLPPTIILGGKIPAQPGVYAWVCGSDTVYIGRSSDIRRRMNEHRYMAFFDYPRRWPSALGRALGSGSIIDIFMTTPRPLRYKGIPIDSARALEAALILLLQPRWNITERWPEQPR